MLMFVCLAGAQASEMPLSGEAVVSSIQGRVEYTRENRRIRLREESRIQAPGSLELSDEARLELKLADGSVLRFSGGTECELVSAMAAGIERDVRVDVALGDCWASVKRFLGQNSTFEVSSPTAVAGVAGTRYRVHVEQSRASSYLVYSGKIKVGYRPVSPKYSPDQSFSGEQEVKGPGEVSGPEEVSAPEWIMVVESGYRFDVSADGAFYRPVPFDRQEDVQDSWVSWNMNRDEEMGFGPAANPNDDADGFFLIPRDGSAVLDKGRKIR
ncbi:MAG: FecR domain-containing protein [Desulfonatronovibrionaceae bacterium]